MRKQRIARGVRRRLSQAVAAVAAGGLMTAGFVPAAHASLLGTLTGTVTGTVTSTVGTVGGLVGVVTAGWDDGATTAPTSMAAAARAIGADELRGRGFNGNGIGIAVIDTGVAPVEALRGPG